MDNPERIQLLKRAFPDLGEEALSQIAQLARIETYPADVILCYEGDIGDRFYLIGDGEIEITKRFTDQEERVMRTSRSGEYFGEMALLDDAPRTATVRTTRPTVMMELDRDIFEKVLQRNPKMTTTLVRTIIKRMQANDARSLAELAAQKEELEIAYTELQRQEKQRDEFLNTLAHELRTPLTTTSGYLQLLRAGLLQGEQFENAIDRIDSSFKRIISIINDLLFVQQQMLVEFAFEPVDLLEVLSTVYDELELKARQVGISINMTTKTPVPIIMADAAGLTRVFRHLLDNAIKFSPGSQTVDVEVSLRGKYIHVDFIDYGVGIDPDFMPRLFKMFERVESFQGHLFDGVGLGLPIAKQIVERHRGYIEVKSKVNQGSTFSVRLPLEHN
jgi:signal transduction histidine kinase